MERRRFLSIPAALTLLGTIVPVVGLARPASAAVPGLKLIADYSANNAFSSKTATAGCPPGKKLVGMGGKVWMTTWQKLTLTEITPSATLDSVTVSAKKVVDPAGPAGQLFNWEVRAFALCADPLPGLVLVAVSIDRALPPSPPSKTVPASCPTGKKVLATGGKISNGGATVAFSTVRPTYDLAGAVVRAHEMDPYAETWGLTAYAICANPPAGLELKTESVSDPGSGQFLQLEGYCPGDKQAIGGGVSVSDQTGAVKIGALGPSTFLSQGADFYGSATEPHPGDVAWTLTNFGICVTP